VFISETPSVRDYGEACYQVHLPSERVCIEAGTVGNSRPVSYHKEQLVCLVRFQAWPSGPYSVHCAAPARNTEKQVEDSRCSKFAIDLVTQTWEIKTENRVVSTRNSQEGPEAGYVCLRSKSFQPLSHVGFSLFYQRPRSLHVTQRASEQIILCDNNHATSSLLHKRRLLPL
jgi:hypothetical protein